MHIQDIQFRPNLLNVRRWIAYFDLLGIRRLLDEGKEAQVFHAYQEAIERCQTGSVELRQAWLSDTFLIVAPDDSAGSFNSIDRACRYFLYFLIQARIPLRGAISCDRLYADFDARVIFGSALIEAYEYGEGQDWLGFLVCPSALRRLDALDHPLNHYYSNWQIPWKRRPFNAPDTLPACMIGNEVHPTNTCVPKLREMMEHKDVRKIEDIRKKYERTLAFLEANPRPGNG